MDQLTFVRALGHPPPAHWDSLCWCSLCVNRPVALCRFCCHRVVHLRLDEELQDVRVLLVLVGLAVATLSSIAGGFRTQHQVAVVEATLHSFIHDVEPGPRLHHAPDVVLTLVGLLQVLEK